MKDVGSFECTTHSNILVREAKGISGSEDLSLRIIFAMLHVKMS